MGEVICMRCRTAYSTATGYFAHRLGRGCAGVRIGGGVA